MENLRDGYDRYQNKNQGHIKSKEYGTSLIQYLNMPRGLFYNSIEENDDSLANKLRRKRMKTFESFFESSFVDELKSGKRIEILDIGGTYKYWEHLEFKYLDNCRFTLVNLLDEPVPENDERFISKQDDATNMTGIADKSYDLVYSNSCIEHVGRKPEWEKMRNEMMRTGRYYFLQTPNKFFPMEPHFLIVGFQFLPLKLKAFIIRNFKVSWYRDIKDKEESLKAADNIHLLTKKDLKDLFPDGMIQKEKFFGLTKSFMVMGQAKGCS